jgi:hypothetical protein
LQLKFLEQVLIGKDAPDLNNCSAGSHVMEYGDKTFKDEKLYLYQDFNPANAKHDKQAILANPKGCNQLKRCRFFCGEGMI